MFDNIPLWAQLVGIIAAALGIGKVIAEAWYRGTIYQVKRMQDKGEIPEMTKLVDLEEKVDDMGKKVDQSRVVMYELEHTVKNGLSHKAEQSREWQQEYGPKIDQMIGTMTEHLRNSD